MKALNLKLIGKRIRTQRKKLKITQEQMSEDLKITTYFISRIENGKANMSIVVLSDICDYLNLDITEVFSGVSPNNQQYLEEEITTKIQQLDANQRELALEMIDAIIRHTK